MIKLKTLLAALLLTSGSAVYADVSGGYVTDMLSGSSGIALVTFSGSRTASPACQSASTPGRWAFDSTTAAGQTYLAELLTAYALRKPVTIGGSGICDVWYDNESIASVTIAN